jgi:two-component system LytT family response regulator
MRRLGALVVEDEELARERLARLVAEHPDYELSGACGNCDEALRIIDAGGVDVLLLDIQMPGVSGLDFSATLAAKGAAPPVLIFVTAYKRYAVDAFKVHAVDYLLKPFDRARLDEALAAARERFRAREAILLAERIQAVVGDAAAVRAAEPRPGDNGRGAEQGRFVVRDNGRFLIVRTEQVDWIEADGRDCILHCGNQSHRTDGPLADIAARLRGERFVQVSRSSLLNIDSICELQEMFKGDLVAIMKNGKEVPISRRFRTQVMERLAG